MGVSVTAEGISNILGIKSRSARYSLYLHNIYTLQAWFFLSFSSIHENFSVGENTLNLFFALHCLYFFFYETWNPKLHIAVFSRALLHNIDSFKVVLLLLLCFKALFSDSSSLRPSRPVCLCAPAAPRWASSPGDFPADNSTTSSFYNFVLHLRSTSLFYIFVYIFFWGFSADDSTTSSTTNSTTSSSTPRNHLHRA